MTGESSRRLSGLSRPWYFGTGTDSTIHAYTREEWGIGGSQPNGNYSVHTVTGLVTVTALMTIPALLAPVMLVIAVVGLNLGVGLLFLACTVLFTGGWMLGLFALRDESAAGKLRRLKGLPKPRFAVTDDQARRLFEEHPAGIPVTRENFPDSTHPFPGEDQ
ncbi:MAG TPA: hypothetical protein VLR70_16330 [Arthrobacter sp.]|nr:hypothetical protein [Arthrobacter sp.]